MLTLQRYYYKAIIIIFSLALFACGGGGSSSGGSNKGDKSDNSITLAGTVTKGPISNANINIYQLNNNGSRGSLIKGPFVSDINGEWQGTLPQNTVAPVLVVATSGSYVDEATGAIVTLAAGEELTSYIQTLPTDGSTVTASISPLSHSMALSAMQLASDGTALAAAFDIVSDNASDVYGFNPTTETLFDPSNMPTTATTAQQQYAALLGGISNLAKDTQDNHGAASVGSFALIEAIANDISDGILDGKGVDGSVISVNGSGGAMNMPVLDAAGLTALKNAANTFAATQANISNDLIDDFSAGSLVTMPTFSIIGEVIGASANVDWALKVADAVHSSGSSAVGAVDFTQGTLVPSGQNIKVEVTTSPVGQNCLVENGELSIAASVDDVVIRCQDIVANTYSLSATFSGITTNVDLSWQLDVDSALHNSGTSPNGVVDLTAANNVASGKTYELTVTNSLGQQCNITNGTGTVGAADIDDITVVCQDVQAVNYSITGTITGASADVAWVLEVAGSTYNSGTNGIGSVNFSGANDVASGSSYSVSVTSAPAGQSCNVSAASGSVTAAVNNIVITCQNITAGPTPVYDFSQYNFTPADPNLTPSAPQTSALDPFDKIADLYSQLTAAEETKLLAAMTSPANVLRTVTDIYDGYYVVVENAPDFSWTRSLEVALGADGAPDTADDIVLKYTLMPSGPSGQQVTFENAGADNTWFTADDIPVDVYDQGIFFPNGGLLEYEGASEGAILLMSGLSPGADRKVLTLDDEPIGGSYQVVVIDGAGNRGQAITYNYSGADGQWFTADDGVQNYSLVSFDASGNQLASVIYDAKGSDGQWFTADDEVLNHTQFSLDAGYKPAYAVTYNANGTDNTWFTADDNVLSMAYYGYDENDEALFIATHTNKGSDGIWFTADDSASAQFVLKNDQGLAKLTGTLSSMGPDGKWLSGDDSVTSYILEDYDINGNRTHQASFFGAASIGDDGLWFTSDDTPYTSYWAREYDDQKRITLAVAYDPSLSNAPAFDGSQASSYTIYSHEGEYAGVSFTVSRTGWLYENDAWVIVNQMGADGLPFTADDFSSYVANDGMDTYVGIGPDAIWMTADDVLGGYKTKAFDGNRLISETSYIGAGIDGIWRTADDEVDDKNSYIAQNIQVNGDHERVNLLGTEKYVIEEDSNGYILKSSFDWFNEDTSSWVRYSTIHTERDNLGRELTIGEAFGPGDDNVWGTVDDYLSISGTTGFDANDKPLNAVVYNSAGDDGMWFTADDVINYNDVFIVQSNYDAQATNAGFTMDSCADIQTATNGDIAIEVVDGLGNALAGVTAMLGDAGATVVTDAQGLAVLSGVAGNQDVHLFKDNYSWESFLCVEPVAGATVRGVLHHKTIASVSKVEFTLSGDRANVLLVLLDQTTGERLDIQTYLQNFNYSYQTLTFPVAEGSSVTGELWAFQANNKGILTNAESLGIQTYTTIANTANAYGNYNDVVLSFVDPQPDPLWQSIQGEHSQLTRLKLGDDAFDKMGVGLGALGITLPYVYDAANTNYETIMNMPDVMLPTTAEPLALRNDLLSSEVGYGFNQSSSMTPNITDGVFSASFTSDFVKAQLLQDQTDSSAAPTLNWLPLKQLTENSGSISTLQIQSYSGWQSSRWFIHAPAGTHQVTLPEPPAGITDVALGDSSYRLWHTSYAFEGLTYQQVLLSHTPQQLPVTQNYEAFSVGGARFTR